MALAMPVLASAQAVNINGGVSRIVGADTVPVANAMVTLHRVDLVGGAPLDSARTDRRGRYRFGAIAIDTSALFIASADYAGIAYFSTPVPMRGDSVGIAAPLLVYDTASAGPALELIQRHVIISPTEDGANIGVLELLILGNNGPQTRVSPDSVIPVWTMGIPSEATRFTVGESEVSSEAITRIGNTVAVTAPIPPGRRQLVFTYLIPRGLDRVAFELDQPTSQMIALIDSRAQANLTGGLNDLGPRAIGEQTYQQYQASNLAAGTSLVLEFAAPPTDPTDFVPWLVGLVALIMVASLVWRLRTPQTAVAPVGAPRATAAPHPDGIAARIAALDNQYESLEAPTPEQAASYSQQRKELKQVLQRALAKSDDPA